MNEPRRSPRHAFTLIELAIVVLVMGVLAGVATPRFAEAIAASRLDSAARRVAADLRYAQSEALRRGSLVEVTFDTNAGAYTFNGVADPDHPSRDYSVNLRGAPWYADLDRVDFDGGTSIEFSLYGSPAASGEVTIGYADRRVRVLCDALGGTSIEE